MMLSDVDALSPGRARLASFEHAYAVALQNRKSSGRSQFILRTGNPWQPFRTTAVLPSARETILALIA